MGERDASRVSSARSLTLLNLRAAVEARLRDPTLDSEIVAAAAGVSVRYANALLAQEGTSIARLIQERRLAPLRTRTGRPVAKPPDNQRNRLRLGVFRHDPLWPAVQDSFRFVPEGLSQAEL
jgi:hypothetical protein